MDDFELIIFLENAENKQMTYLDYQLAVDTILPLNNVLSRLINEKRTEDDLYLRSLKIRTKLMDVFTGKIT